MKTKCFPLLLLVALLSLSSCISSTHNTSNPQPTVESTATPYPPAVVDLGTIGCGPAKTVAWSVDGKVMAVASSLGIYLYDTSTWQTFKLIRVAKDNGYLNGVTQVWFSNDEQNLIYTYVSTPQISLYRYSIASGKTTLLYQDFVFSDSTMFVFSADGKTFANIGVTALDEHRQLVLQPNIEIREAVSGKVLQTLKTNLEWWGRFNSRLASFSPDGTLFAIGGSDNTVQVWDDRTGTLLFVQSHEANVQSITFSPDGKMLVSAGDDATVRFWDAHTGRSLYVLRKFDHRLVYASYSMNGQELLLGISNDAFQRWTVDEHFLPVTHQALDFKLGLYQFAREPALQYISRDGTHLAVIQEENLQVIDLAKKNQSVMLSEFNADLSAIEFSPDGNLLALIDHNVHLWGLKSRKALGTLPINGYDINIAFAPNGKHIAVTANNVQLWDVSTLQKTTDLDVGTGPITFSPDGSMLAVNGWYKVTIWNPNNGHLVRSFQNDLGIPFAVAFNSNGSRLTVIAEKGIRTWDIINGKLLWSVDTGRRIIGNVSIYSSTRAMIESAGGSSCADGEEVSFWNLENGQLLYSLNLPFCGLGSFTIHPSKSLFAYASWAGENYKISLGDLDSGKNLLDIPTLNESTESMRFSPNGNTLAVEEARKAVVRLLDISSVSSLAQTLPVTTATPLPTDTPTPSPTPAIAEEIPLPLITPQPTNPNAITVDNVARLGQIGTLGGAKYLADPYTAAWSNDGKEFAIGTLGSVYIYRTGFNSLWQSFASGKLVDDIVFSMDGHFLAELNNAYEVVIWDLIEGKRVQTFDRNCWRPHVMFSPDNAMITIDCEGGTRRVFALETGKLLSQKEHLTYGSLNREGSLSVFNNSDYVYLADAQSGNILHTFESNADPWHAAFSPDGQTMLIWYYSVRAEEIMQGKIQTVYESVAELWHVVPGQEPILRHKIMTGKTSAEVAPQGETFAFTSDGKYLLTTLGDGYIRIWDTDTGSLASELPGSSQKIPAEFPSGNQIFLSMNDQRLLSIGDRGHIQVWDLASIRKPRLLQTISDFESTKLMCPLFSTSDGKEIAVNARDSIEKWKTAQLFSESRSISYPLESQSRAFAASLNGNYWATVTSDNAVELRDAKTGKVIQTLSRGSAAENDLDNQITNLLLSNSGEVLVASTYWNVWLWNLKSAEMPLNIEPGFPMGEWALSPDGRLLAISENDDGKAEIWDTQTGKRLRRFDFAGGHIAFSPDGLTLATGWRDGKIWLVDIRSGQMFRSLQAKQGLWGITFSPDGSLLVARTVNELEFLDVAGGNQLTTIDGFASCMVFSPDGAIFATYVNGDRIRLWSVSGK